MHAQRIRAQSPCEKAPLSQLTRSTAASWSRRHLPPLVLQAACLMVACFPLRWMLTTWLATMSEEAWGPRWSSSAAVQILRAVPHECRQRSAAAPLGWRPYSFWTRKRADEKKFPSVLGREAGAAGGALAIAVTRSAFTLFSVIYYTSNVEMNLHYNSAPVQLQRPERAASSVPLVEFLAVKRIPR
jgi:hypothetical protein